MGDRAFSAAWDEALERGLDALEDEIVRRAKEGVEEPVFYQGQVVGTTRRYSDVLAMFILKSKRRDVYGERQEITANQNILSMKMDVRIGYWPACEMSIDSALVDILNP